MVATGVETERALCKMRELPQNKLPGVHDNERRRRRWLVRGQTRSDGCRKWKRICLPAVAQSSVFLRIPIHVICHIPCSAPWGVAVGVNAGWLSSLPCIVSGWPQSPTTVSVTAALMSQNNKYLDVNLKTCPERATKSHLDGIARQNSVIPGMDYESQEHGFRMNCNVLEFSRYAAAIAPVIWILFVVLRQSKYAFSNSN